MVASYAYLRFNFYVYGGTIVIISLFNEQLLLKQICLVCTELYNIDKFVPLCMSHDMP